MSLSDDDVAFLDEYAEAQGIASRSAVLQRAVMLLRTSQLATHTPKRSRSGRQAETPSCGSRPRLTDWKACLMRRGEILLVDLEPARGSEADKRRPAVLVSNDGANATADRLGQGVVTIVPVTTGIARVFPFQVLLPAAARGLRHDSKAQAEQVRAVAVERVGRVVGRLPAPLQAALDDALWLHLGL